MSKCLVVDDVEVSRYTNQMFLEDLGYEVAEASDSAGCMDVLNAGGVHIIILDWHLKKENGLDLLKDIRSSANGGTIPVIVISGVEGMEKAQEAIAAGANGFLTKPTTKEKLEGEFKKLGL